MAKSKPWLPNATPMILGGVGFELEAAGWKRIEEGLGAVLIQEHRDLLAKAISDYIAVRAMELDPPLASEAFALIDQIEKSANEFKAALRALQNGSDVSDRVQKIFGYRIRDIEIKDRRAGIVRERTFFDTMEMHADRVASAAPAVRKNLCNETTAYKPTYSFKPFIEALGEVAIMNNVKLTARKDLEISQFPKFVYAVMCELPNQYRQHHQSLAAVSKAIAALKIQSPNGTD